MGSARAAIVGGSPFIRGTVTALTWFAGEDRFKLFAGADLPAALAFLGLAGDDPTMLAACRRVCAAAKLSTIPPDPG
ncbi:MAG: STAS/SEC14 domain-containing protein [Myxococcales bacterium]|nr:STAS/SEC14 domain-containing protein [Myxococcales bacterium]